MKRIYIAPEIDIENMIGEELLQSTSGTPAENDINSQLSKDRTPSNYKHDDLGWDF